MKQAFAVFALSMLVSGARGAEPEEPDPKTVCLPLVGTYAKPDDPKDPEFTVAFADGKFSIVDARGDKKLEVTPTAEGLLVVEADRDRNAHRLWYDAKRKEYWLGHLGKVRDDRPLPKEPGFRMRLIKIEPSPVKKKEAEKQPRGWEMGYW